MTQERDLGRLLDAFYSEGPREAPEWILDDLKARVETQAQRVQWRTSVRRPNDRTWRLLLVAAIVGALVLASFTLLHVGGRPRAKAGPEFPAPPCLLTHSCHAGELAAGEHQSTAFGAFGGKRHALTFTVPDGWANIRDDDVLYVLRPRHDSQGNPLQFVVSPLIVDQQEPCTKTPKSGVGQGVDDLIGYIANHPGLIVGPAQHITVNGMPGQYIDVLGVQPDWAETCIRYTDGAVVLLLMERSAGDFLWWMDPTEQTRFVFLDAGDGLVVLAVIDSRIHELFQQLVDDQMPVVQSLSIAQ